MFYLRVSRPIFVDHFKNNIIRTYCSKSSGTEDSTPVQPENEQQSTAQNDEITNKINDILKSMIEKKANVEKGLENINRSPVPDYGFVPKKRPKVLDPHKESENALKEAAASVSKVFGDDPEVEKQLIYNAIEVPKEKSNLNWSDLIGGMQIDNSNNVDEYVHLSTRSDQVHKIFSQRKTTIRDQSDPISSKKFSPKFKMQSIDLLGGEPMGIFTKENTGIKGTDLKMWNTLIEYELKTVVSHPPKNYFEKIIRWTNQGKVWKFPIDNDQGLEEEKKVHFTEHIFLEGYLEGWCPKRGPIRHFMELVCVGMSKNPYMPVKDKKEHIIWFKNYFDSKKELLTQVGAYGDSVESEVTSS